MHKPINRIHMWNEKLKNVLYMHAYICSCVCVLNLAFSIYNVLTGHNKLPSVRLVIYTE